MQSPGTTTAMEDVTHFTRPDVTAENPARADSRIRPPGL